MSSLDQIRDSIDARITELTNEIAALGAARAALQGSTPVRTPPTTSAKRAVRPKRRRPAKADTAVSDTRRAGNTSNAGNGANGSAETRAASVDRSPKRRARARAKTAKTPKAVEALLAGELETMLGGAEDGLSAITISKRSNAGYNRVLALLRELESAGQVRRTGSRRTSLWRLITDEERVAERAAELERLAKPRS
jgi:hypothetical protein